MLRVSLYGRRFLRSCRCPSYRRRFSCQPLSVDESYTSKHVAADGRVFQYATVVKSMRKGESALPAWEYACSLVGSSTPTLAVTFVSKPTDSALAVVREFSNQFSDGNEPLAAAHTSEHNSQHHLSSSNGTSELHSSNHSAAMGVPVAVDYDSKRNEPIKATQTIQNCKEKIPNYCSGIESKVTPTPPLIGCIVANHDNMTLTTSIISAATEGFGEDLIWMDDSDQKGDDPKPSGVEGGSDGRRHDKTGSSGCSSDAPGSHSNARIASSHDATNVQLKPHDVEQATSNENITEDEGTFSDWEELIREYDHLKIESEIGDDAEGDNKEESQAVSGLEVDFIVQEEVPEQGRKMNNKERLAGFWNHFARSSPASLFQKPAERDLEGISHSRAFIESILKQHNVKRNRVQVCKEKPQGRGKPPKCRHGEVQESHVDRLLGASKQSNVTDNCSQEVIDDAVGEDKSTVHDRESHVGKDDETYQMILIVGDMPGVKVSAFYTRTTVLPWLPDLHNAVTVNNPHMLLFGAPGFNISELTDRLVGMFPNGCKAGASLLDVPDERIMVDKTTKLFYGTKHMSIGAVGLAISSSEVSGSVPVDAFSEFLRMSLGMLPESCWNTFLDDTVCKSLFLPQNVKIEWLDAFQKAYKLDPGSILDKMYAKMHDKFDFASVTGSMDTTNDEKILSRGGQRDNFNLTDLHVSSFERGRTETRVSEQRIQPVERESLSIISVNKVLFPGFFIPLCIDNPCDRLMVKHCMERKVPFGVSSFSTEVSLDQIDCKDVVGTIADMKVSLFGRDCKSYIIAHGVRRFRVINRILSQPGTFGQLVGQVHLFDDIEFGKDNEKEEVVELSRQALGLCQQLFPAAAAILSPGRSFQDPIIASFAVSHILPVSAEVKRRWLGMVNTKYRLKEQITFLNA